jgi:predicted RNase H-like HicB family nuclease
MKTYFAIVHEDEGSAVGVVFPDLPGCFSAGDTFDEAIANAGRALKLYAEAERAAGRSLPQPSSFAQLLGNREIRREAKGAPFIAIQLGEDPRASPAPRSRPRASGNRRARRAAP